MMHYTNIERVYLIGIGGIGMSAVARYFKSVGKDIAGYDHTPAPLTDMLRSEGMNIHFRDDTSLIPEPFKNKKGTLIIYTPAIPATHSELVYFREKGFDVLKRSQVLGKILEQHTSIAIAGTHGKTTISSMTAHIFVHSGTFCNAFLGGIAKNFESNFVLNRSSDFYIAEADEFDRSFLSLFPDYAVVSSMDDDHLDIYGERKNLIASFTQFVNQIKPSGVLVLKKGVEITAKDNIRVLRYALEEKCDYYAFNISPDGLYNKFSIHTPSGDFTDINPGVPGKLNVENAVAAFAIAHQAGIAPALIINSLKDFKGVTRRFDIRLENKNTIYIDDYAHHPEELRAFITSVKERLPGKQITGIFQPHLYTRTRDLAAGFSETLSLLDNVILLNIYPAREKPIPGITSEIILNHLTNTGKKLLCAKEELLGVIEKMNPEALLTMGAGDIDRLVEPLRDLLIRINE